ncbi:MAG: S8 family serine peptidase [Pseudorhodoplanes sp.]
MPSMRNFFKRIALTAGVLVTSVLLGAGMHGAFAQNSGGNDQAQRYRVQSAPAANPVSAPRRSVKPVAVEAQAEAEKAKAFKPAPQPVPEQNARPSSGVPVANERRFNANEVVIEVAGRPTPAQVDALARRHRLNREESQVFNLTGTTMFRWTIPDGRNVPNVIRGLEQDPSILSVQPNYRYTLQQSRTGDGIQYSVDKLRLPRAHEMAKGNSILVAVIDSGIDLTHPELVDTIADSFNPAGGDGSPHSHGTGIAGCIVAQSRLTGVAPKARILAVRAFDPNGASAEGTTFNILKGIEWASEKGARVINMSFAGPQDPIMSRALAAANKKGIVLIAAVGNAGPKSPPLYPAADTNVIAVTAIDAQDRLYQGSNRGNHVAVAAPGVDVVLPTPGTSYQMATGTSFAAAHISGIVALILEREPSLTPDSVRRVLLTTARDLGPAGRDKDFGAGLADAYEALIAIGGKPGDALQAVRTPPQ